MQTYENSLLNQFKSQFNTFLQMRENIGVLNQKDKQIILRFFEQKITEKNVKRFYSLPLIIFYSLLIKNKLDKHYTGYIKKHKK